MSNPLTDIDSSTWLDLHGNMLYAYASSFLRNRELAEEVVQRRLRVAEITTRSVVQLRVLASYQARGPTPCCVFQNPPRAWSNCNRDAG